MIDVVEVVVRTDDMEQAIGCVETAHLDRCSGPCDCLAIIDRLQDAMNHSDVVGAIP